MGNSMEIPQKSKIEITYDPAIPLSEMFIQRVKE